MTEADILALAAGLQDVDVLVASEEGGAPEIAWGDVFFSYAPAGGRAAEQPFATLMHRNYPGFDTESELDRPGAIRLNLAVGRERYEQLFGHAAGDHAEHHHRYDYAEADVVVPNPVYASQGWASVVNPGPRTAHQVRELFAHAHDLAAARHRRRQQVTPDLPD